jgi:hypothetical protein
MERAFSMAALDTTFELGCVAARSGGSELVLLAVTRRRTRQLLNWCQKMLVYDTLRHEELHSRTLFAWLPGFMFTAALSQPLWSVST